MIKPLSLLSLVIALFLLGLNITGLIVPLRSPEISSDYADFARGNTPTYKESIAQLEQLSNRAEPTLAFFTEATRVFHYGIAHIPPGDIDIKGLAHYRMQVPAWENYILYALSYIDPKTFMDYEFCSYFKALKRATGRCGQQSMALADYLDEQGITTGYVSLGGHALAAAQTGDGDWVILDPDYGGVIPFDLKTAEANPESVIPYYWNPTPVVNNGLYKLFAPEHNEFRQAPPESRQPTTCLMEKFAYIAKWLIPLALLAFAGLLAILARRKP
ncbi:MAG: hypothetical protein GYB33_07475 [Gammaproteobacteria bacterium]|nr:hypothetical protein [Gammaproteobacteria bacterium]